MRLFLLTFVFIVISCAPQVQTVSFTESEYYNRVYTDLPQLQDELYVQSNKWLVQIFNSAKDVIQFSDKESGTIIGKYRMYSQLGLSLGDPDIEVMAIIEINVKDNKAKLQIKPLGTWPVYKESGTAGVPQKKVFENGVLKDAPDDSKLDGFTKEEAVKKMEDLGNSFYSFLVKKKEGF